jgi:hypothetical protein
LVTTNVSPARQAASQCQTGPIAISAGQAVVDVDAIITDAERMQSVVLRGEILLLC